MRAVIGYRAVNKTRGVCLASETEPADTVWTRVRGLIGRSPHNFGDGKGLWITSSQGIHTFGMAFPIDVLYLDSHGRVLKKYDRLAPFRIAALQLRTRSVLELPAGTLARTRTEVGDVLEFQPNGEG